MTIYRSIARQHPSIGYLTPDDEHNGHGDPLRQARRGGLPAAPAAPLTYPHQNKKQQP
ncbi:MAG: hypothetical protein ACRDPT_06345 [Streptomycetales bacterium]